MQKIESLKNIRKEEKPFQNKSSGPTENKTPPLPNKKKEEVKKEEPKPAEPAKAAPKKKKKKLAGFL